MTYKRSDSSLVSVVIPLFNAGPWIREALASVAAQTHEVHECIVVDDGSTDDGPDIVREVQQDWSLPLTLIEIQHSGVSVARNTGIAATSGDFVALLDSDDVWSERKLECQIATLQRTGATVCTTGYALFKSETRKVKGVVTFRRPDRAIRRWLAMEGNGLLFSSTAIFRRSEIEKVGEFDPRVAIGEDLEFTLRMQDVGRLVIDRRVLVGYRTHGGQAHRHIGNLARDVEMLYDRMPIERLGLTYGRRCRSNLDAHVGYSLLLRGQPLNAVRRFARALRRDPLRLLTLPIYALGRRLSRHSRAWFTRVPAW